MTSVAVLHQDSILERISQGHKLSAIASDYNVSINAISKALRDMPEYKDAQIAGIEARLDSAEDELDRSSDMLGLTRAREKLTQARWRAEVTAPDIYSRKGQSVVIQVNTSQALDDALYVDALAVLGKAHE